MKAGPRDGEQWVARLKEEYQALITYVQARAHAVLSSLAAALLTNDAAACH